MSSADASSPAPPPDLREIAHGLRNDLTVVIAHAQTLRIDEADPERIEDLETIVARAKAAVKRIESLRALYPPLPSE